MEEAIKQKKQELDKEKNKLICKLYYQKNKQTLIERGCEKMKCEKCEKMISRNYMSIHLKSKLCKKREHIVNLIKDMNKIE